jgi:hypothetical protein
MDRGGERLDRWGDCGMIVVTTKTLARLFFNSLHLFPQSNIVRHLAYLSNAQHLASLGRLRKVQSAGEGYARCRLRS